MIKMYSSPIATQVPVKLEFVPTLVAVLHISGVESQVNLTKKAVQSGDILFEPPNGSRIVGVLLLAQ